MLSHKLEKIIFKLSNVCDFYNIIDSISKNGVLRKLLPFITAIYYSHLLQPFITAIYYSHLLQPFITAIYYSHYYSHLLQPFITAIYYSHYYSHLLQPFITAIITAIYYSHLLQPFITAIYYSHLLQPLLQPYKASHELPRDLKTCGLKTRDVTFLYINKEYIAGCKGKLTDFFLIVLLDCLCSAKLYFLLWVLVWAKFIFFTIPDQNHVKIHYVFFLVYGLISREFAETWKIRKLL
jgi:hypothetical protein